MGRAVGVSGRAVNVSGRSQTIGVPNAIPDSGLLHNYDWSDSQTTTTRVPDLSGDDDLTGSYTDLSATINGVQAGYFDGADDVVDASYTDAGQPVERFVVFQLRSVPSSQAIIAGGPNTVYTPFVSYAGTDDGDFGVFAGATISQDNADTNAHLATIRLDGMNSLLQLDQIDSASGDAGTTDPGGLSVGARPGNTDYSPVNIGQILDYDPTATGYSRSDVEQYLVNKWGPF